MIEICLAHYPYAVIGNCNLMIASDQCLTLLMVKY